MVPTQAQSKEFETRKIFVGGIPSAVMKDEFKDFFSKYGKVVEHEIIWDHETNRSRGVGFITFDNEEVVDQMLSMDNMIEMGEAKVEIKKAEPKKFSDPPPTSTYNRSLSGWSYNAKFVNPYGNFNGGYGPGLYWTPGATGCRFDAYGYYTGNGGGFLNLIYWAYGDNSFGGYGGDSSFCYYSGVGSYNSNHGGDSIASSLGGYSRGEGYMGDGISDSPGPAASYRVSFGKGSCIDSNRYHPYARQR